MNLIWKLLYIKRNKKFADVQTQILKEIISHYPLFIRNGYDFYFLIHQEVELFYYKINVNNKIGGHIPIFLYER